MSCRAVVSVVVLALAAGAVRAGEWPVVPSPPPPDAKAPPVGAERVTLQVRFPPWLYTGTFRIEGPRGLLLDEGVARDVGGYAAGDGVVERTLEGGRGQLRLRLQGGTKIVSGLPVFFGRWKIVGATGAFSGFGGAGSFISTTSGDSARGSPHEVQTLTGHLWRWRGSAEPFVPAATPAP